MYQHIVCVSYRFGNLCAAANKKLSAARSELNKANERLRQLNVELNSVNEQLQSANKELHETNHALSDMNQSLSEANNIKELYITKFMTECSSYIDKMDNYRRMLNKKRRPVNLRIYLKH